MTYNPKLVIGAAILSAILAAIGGYFARETKSLLVTERQAREQAESKLIAAKADLIVKEAQLKRAQSKKTTSKPVLINGVLAYEKTTESSSLEESYYKDYQAKLELMASENSSLKQEVDRLSKLETSKAGVKRWLTGAGWLNTVGFYETLGYRQDLGLFDIGIQGLTNIPAFNVYGGAFTVGF